MKIKTISYWTTTILLVASISPSGIAQMVHQPDVTTVITKLGYPLYFVVILGFWNASAGIALLVPRFPRLKEWVYAGIFFEMTGAFVSHAVCGDGVVNLIKTGIIAALRVTSWALRPQSRLFGNILPAK